MMHVHEPFSRTCLRDDCPTSSQMLSMILKMSSMWTTSSARVASRHDRKPLLLLLLLLFVVVVIVVFVLLFLLTRSNRPQPIVIQSKHFLSIITVTCCMGTVCALVLFFTACPFFYADRHYLRTLCSLVIFRYYTHAY